MSCKAYHNSLKISESQRGSTILETTFTGLIFFAGLLLIMEIGRNAYVALASQFVVSRAVRFAMVGAGADFKTKTDLTKKKRAKTIKALIKDTSRSFLLSQPTDLDISICPLDCPVNNPNCCKPGSNNPGCPNDFIKIEIRRPGGIIFMDRFFTITASAIERNEFFDNSDC